MTRASAASTINTDVGTLVTDVQSYIQANGGDPHSLLVYIFSQLKLADERIAHVMVTDGVNILTSPVDNRNFVDIDAGGRR